MDGGRSLILMNTANKIKRMRRVNKLRQRRSQRFIIELETDDFPDFYLFARDLSAKKCQVIFEGKFLLKNSDRQLQCTKGKQHSYDGDQRIH